MAAWLPRFDAEGVAAAPLNDLAQTLAHPQVIANDMVVSAKTADGPTVKLVGAPFKLSTHKAVDTPAAPQLGAHTRDVLIDVLHFTDAEVEKLRAAGAL